MLHYTLEKLTHAEMETMTFAQLEEYFITDRTSTDVELVNYKGILDTGVATRIEQALKDVCDFLGITYTQKFWLDDRNEVPTVSTFHQKIYQALSDIEPRMPVTDLQFPRRPFNTYQKWNELESYLKVVYDILDRLKQTNIYSGEFYAGERW